LTVITRRHTIFSAMIFPEWGYADMYLNAERIAVANKAVKDTFEQASIAWQAIPHWETGDPGQIRVRSDNAFADDVEGDELGPPIKPGDSLLLEAEFVRFEVTVAQAISPTPDALLAAVIARTVQLARRVDTKVITKLVNNLGKNVNVTGLKISTPSTWGTNDGNKLVTALIEARAWLENYGYRPPSCLLTDTTGLQALSYLEDGLSELQPLLESGNINSLNRFEGLDGKNTGKMLLLGRRQRIAHGAAAAVSPGEEPVDLAVSVPPSLEVVGETDDGNIEMAVRIRFAPRVTDKSGVVSVDFS
jgi:hypothetical protein